ncbi:MAG: ATP-binding protein [Candidatus Omnitrophica bacterium]|nr:ATP-binding protein [Candidatus Omnitrophota bacterium]
MLSLYVITAWLTTVTASYVGILVYFKNPKSKVNQRWFFMSLSIAFWSLFLGLMFNSRSDQAGLIYSRILMIGADFIPFTFYYFVYSFLELENDKKQKKILFASYIITIFFLLVNSSPLLYVRSVSYKLPVNCYYPDAGPLFSFYVLFYFVLIGYSCLLLYRTSAQLTAQKKNQCKYILFATVVGFLGGATTFPLWYKIKIPPIGSHFVWLYAVTISIAILRYRLMDISVAITRTGIFIAVYTLILGLPFAVAGFLRGWLIEFLGPQWWILPLGLMAGLATVGPFVYIFLERRAENRLLREQKRYQDTLKQVSIGMTRIRDLHRLLNLITHIITKTVRIAYAAIYLYDQDVQEYILKVSRDKNREFIPKITPDAPLISWLILKHQSLIYEEVKRQMQDEASPAFKKLEDNMRSLGASVVIPSFLEDKLIGIILLGDKLSGQIYTPEDLNVFQVLANQAALAIENAQFYEETQKMQEQIAQAEKMATVGTMADGLSHQINNRFHALSLIAGDTIDTIRLTDTSNCTPEIQEMIKGINYALDRIKSNVIQGGEVVKGILKYTRKGDEGLEPLTMDQILDATLDMVKYKVKLSEIDIIRNYAKEIPNIKGNFVQLQEVFFNFIDNAYDAINERKAALNEPGYRGKITISARQKTDKTIEILVDDNGMGIYGHNSEKIFTPFFTTKTSSRKGTGLGLYVIRKIITDTHKGKISFESTHKSGTRFTIELSIAI